MSTPAQEPGAQQSPEDSESSADQQLDGPQAEGDGSPGHDQEYSDQDSEPPLSAPSGPDGTVDGGGPGGEDEEGLLPPGTHGTARRPPADS